jgi:hypothetical protein
MYHLFAVHKLSDDWDEIPYEKREWWVLTYSNACKQAVLDWHSTHKLNFVYKIVNSDRTLKDIFYPRQEIKKSTQTALMLRAVNYTS